MTPETLITKISTYPEVEKLVYSRPMSNKCPPLKYVNVPILQLIASGLIWLKIYQDYKCYCRLAINNLRPSYLDVAIWTSISIVEEDLL